MSELKTYTFVYDEIAKLIILPVIFKTNNCMMKVETLIDTGAAASYISSFVSTSLNLQLTGNIYHVKFGEDDATRPSVYANLILSSDICFSNKELTVLKDEPRAYDAIIGMDILSKTDYSVSNYSGHTTFILRIPSQAEIEYGDIEDIDLLMDKIEDTLLST